MNIKDMYVTLIPSLLPNVSSNQSDEEKKVDLYGGLGGLPAISLKDFLSGSDTAKSYTSRARKIKDPQSQTIFINRNIPHAIIPIKIKYRNICLLQEQDIQAYNSLIALKIPLSESKLSIVEKLKAKPWVWYITEDVRRSCVIAIIPLDNREFSRHYLFCEALKYELEADGLALEEGCDDLLMMIEQVHDPCAWQNNDCTLYTLPEKFKRKRRARQ